MAVVHDWLTGMRGGEKVLEAILELYPGSELFTLFHFANSVSPAIEAHRIHTSFLQGLAGSVGDYRRLLPLFPLAAATWDLSRFDLVISSSHCVAKNVRVGATPHLSYCHTPMRYIWDRFDDYFPPEHSVVRSAMSLLSPLLRGIDTRTASHVTRFVSNSKFVAGRIEEFYGRESETVYPFADEIFFQDLPVDSRSDYHLVVSALVPYKRIDVAIAAASASGRRLIVVGEGPARESLQSAAGKRTEFVGHVSTAEVIRLMSGARSLIIPGVEDFGITAVESLALGTPVIGTVAGGVIETIDGGRFGEVFSAGDVSGLVSAMDRLESKEWDRVLLRQRADEFRKPRFKSALQASIAKMLKVTAR